MNRGPVMRVEGLRELSGRLRRIDAELGRRGLTEAHAAIGRTVVGAARPDTPRRTGALATTLRANRAARQTIVRAGSGRVPYAGSVHWGWPARHIEPHPWIVDAARASESVWVAQYDSELRRLVEVTSA